MLKKFVSSLLVTSLVLFGFGVNNAFATRWKSASQTDRDAHSWQACTNRASFGWFGASASCSPGYDYVPSAVGTYSAVGQGNTSASSGSHSGSNSGSVRIQFEVVDIDGIIQIDWDTYTVVSKSVSIHGFPWEDKSASASGFCGGATPSAVSVR